MMFICEKCGACCRHLDRSSLYQELDRGDGICRYLEGNLCSIYTQRPLLCRIEESYQAFFQDTFSLEKYYQLNYEACAKLKKLDSAKLK